MGVALNEGVNAIASSNYIEYKGEIDFSQASQCSIKVNLLANSIYLFNTTMIPLLQIANDRYVYDPNGRTWDIDAKPQKLVPSSNTDAFELRISQECTILLSQNYWNSSTANQPVEQHLCWSKSLTLKVILSCMSMYQQSSNKFS